MGCLTGRILTFSQNDRGGLDQSRKANTRRTLENHPNLVCGHKQGHRQKVSFRDSTRMGDQPLHTACFSQSAGTPSDRRPYRRMGERSCGKHLFLLNQSCLLIPGNRNPSMDSLSSRSLCGRYGSTHLRWSFQGSRGHRTSPR